MTAKAIEKLFARFDAALKDKGYLAMGGQIIDASVVPAPRQRNTQEEKMQIKEGRIPPAWKEKPAKARQKDRDARWTVKYSKAKVKEGADPTAFKPIDLAIPMFGYQSHIGIDRTHGLIRSFTVTAANAHDGAQLPNVVTKDNTASGVWADTAYRSKKNEAFLRRAFLVSQIHHRKPNGKPMPERIAKANAKRSVVRSAVEHVFAGQKHRMELVGNDPPDHYLIHCASCGPLALPARRSKSGWPIWLITSSASPGSKGELRPPEGQTTVKQDARRSVSQITRPGDRTPRERYLQSCPHAKNQRVLRGVQFSSIRMG